MYLANRGNVIRETAALAAPDHLAGARRNLGLDSDRRAALAASIRRPGLTLLRHRAVQPAGTLRVSLCRVLTVPQADPGHLGRCSLIGRNDLEVADDAFKLLAGPEVGSAGRSPS